jgi:hypothetical protein
VHVLAVPSTCPHTFRCSSCTSLFLSSVPVFTLPCACLPVLHFIVFSLTFVVYLYTSLYNVCMSSQFQVPVLTLSCACPELSCPCSITFMAFPHNLLCMASQFHVPVLTLSCACPALPCACSLTFMCLSSHFSVPVLTLTCVCPAIFSPVLTLPLSVKNFILSRFNFDKN